MQPGKSFHVRLLNHTDDDIYEGYSRLSSKFSGYLNLSVLGIFYLSFHIYSTSFFTWFVLRLTFMNCIMTPMPLASIGSVKWDQWEKRDPLPL